MEMSQNSGVHRGIWWALQEFEKVSHDIMCCGFMGVSWSSHEHFMVITCVLCECHMMFSGYHVAILYVLNHSLYVFVTNIRTIKLETYKTEGHRTIMDAK